MYLSIEEEERRPFIDSQERYLSESKKFSDIELGADHFKESWKLGQFSRSSSNLYDEINNNVEDSINIMKDNINKLSERDEHINDMDEKSENLIDGTQKFARESNKLKIKMWTKHACNLVAITTTTVLIITVITILAHTKSFN